MKHRLTGDLQRIAVRLRGLDGFTLGEGNRQDLSRMARWLETQGVPFLQKQEIDMGRVAKVIEKLKSDVAAKTAQVDALQSQIPPADRVMDDADVAALEAADPAPPEPVKPE